jgi:hypothetical protein
MKSSTIIFGVAAFAVIGILVFSACRGQRCLDTGSFRFLQVQDDSPLSSGQYQELLSDPRFAKVDAFGISGFIDSREECSNYKRAAQSLSLLNNNVNNSRAWESKIEAILIYQEARRHGCNID